MSRKDLRIERIAPPADQHAGRDGQALQPRRWGQLGYLVVGAARDLRRNRLTTSATLLLLSLSLALYGAVVLAGEQLQLVASFVTGTGSDPRALADPRVQFLQMLRLLRWSASILAPAVGVAGLVTLIAKVRMVAAARRDEARIMRLVGAGAAFVAASLILQEIIIGVLSALLSLGLLATGPLLRGRLRDLLPSALQGLQWVGTEQLLIVAPRLEPAPVGVTGGVVAAVPAVVGPSSSTTSGRSSRAAATAACPSAASRRPRSCPLSAACVLSSGSEGLHVARSGVRKGLRGLRVGLLVTA